MTISVALSLRVSRVGEVICEVEQTAVFDVSASPFAPIDEGVRAHVRLESNDPAALRALERLLCGRQPVVIGSVPASIGKDALE